MTEPESYRFTDSDATVFIKNINTGLYFGSKHMATNFGYQTFDPKLSAERQENMAFQISRANNSEISECNFLLSCRPFVQKYLREVNQFDQLRLQEREADPGEMLFCILNINSMYQNMLACLDILTKYCKNQILAENIKFNNEYSNNRKKVLNDLDFIEMLCQILNLYYDTRDLESFSTEEEAVNQRQNTMEGSIVADDLKTQQNPSMKKHLSKYYQRYIRNGFVIFNSVYRLLCALVEKEESNQLKLYSLLGCFQKHFAYFDQSLDLAKVMIEDNLTILTKLSTSFFESLHIVKDILISRDKKVFFQIDLEFVDPQGYMYIEEDSKEKKKDDDEIEEPEEEEGVANTVKQGRPTSMLVYLLILLGRKVRHPKILQILAMSCTYKEGNFVANQENFIELLADNRELISTFLSDLRMDTVQAIKRLINRFEEEEEGKFLVLRALFEQKKIRDPKMEKRIAFLTEQINFYSTLCKGRNLKWKDFLRKLFPETDLINEVVEWHYTNDFAGSLWRLFFMLYLDQEPLHDIRIPQMSKLLLKDEEDKIEVKDIILLYSDIMAKQKEIRPMLELFENVVDLCQDNLSKAKQVYLKTASPDEKEAALVHENDNLLREFFILLNRIMGFGIIPFFKKYDSLTQLAKLSLETIQINSANTHIGFILELFKILEDTSNTRWTSLVRKAKMLQVILGLSAKTSQTDLQEGGH